MYVNINLRAGIRAYTYTACGRAEHMGVLGGRASGRVGRRAGGHAENANASLTASPPRNLMHI